jgi:hypothetical protein
VKGPEANLIAPYRPMTWAASSIKHHFCSTQLYRQNFGAKNNVRPSLIFILHSFSLSRGALLLPVKAPRF